MPTDEHSGEIYGDGSAVPTGPKRYLVRDPGGHLINAHVQCTTGTVGLAGHIGSHVGVIGSLKYDKAIGLYVIEAEKIVVIKVSWHCAKGDLGALAGLQSDLAGHVAGRYPRQSVTAPH